MDLHQSCNLYNESLSELWVESADSNLVVAVVAVVAAFVEPTMLVVAAVAAEPTMFVVAVVAAEPSMLAVVMQVVVVQVVDF